jgi:hypothetical protein
LLVPQCTSAADAPEVVPLDEPLPPDDDPAEEPLLPEDEPLEEPLEPLPADPLLLDPEPLAEPLEPDEPGKQLMVPEIVVNTSPVQAPLSGSDTAAVIVTPPAVVHVKVGVADVALLKEPAPVCPARSLSLHRIAAFPTVAMASALVLPTGRAEGLIENDVMPGQFAGGWVTTTTPASMAIDPVATSAGTAASPVTRHVSTMLTPLTAPAATLKGAEPLQGSPLVSVALRAIE